MQLKSIGFLKIHLKVYIGKIIPIDKTEYDRIIMSECLKRQNR